MKVFYQSFKNDIINLETGEKTGRALHIVGVMKGVNADEAVLIRQIRAYPATAKYDFKRVINGVGYVFYEMMVRKDSFYAYVMIVNRLFPELK
jgi:hypothetical protein